jgi:uncharacterized Fe-S radical SAM superfamily protein PflX
MDLRLLHVGAGRLHHLCEHSLMGSTITIWLGRCDLSAVFCMCFRVSRERDLLILVADHVSSKQLSAAASCSTILSALSGGLGAPTPATDYEKCSSVAAVRIFGSNDNMSSTHHEENVRD